MKSKDKATLHKILLDAKTDIKMGKTKHERRYAGICIYVFYHPLGSERIQVLAQKMYKKSPFYKGHDYVAQQFVFNHPDRVALLDYMIKNTRPKPPIWKRYELSVDGGLICKGLYDFAFVLLPAIGLEVEERRDKKTISVLVAWLFFGFEVAISEKECDAK